MATSERTRSGRPSHPRYLALTIDPLFGDEGPPDGLELVPGFDLAWGGETEEPMICFIAAEEVRRDFGGKMLLFSYGDRPGGMWIACDAIAWMRPAMRKVDLSMGHAPFRSSYEAPVHASDPSTE